MQIGRGVGTVLSGEFVLVGILEKVLLYVRFGESIEAYECNNTYSLTVHD